jgi:hypothetical protein
VRARARMRLGVGVRGDCGWIKSGDDNGGGRCEVDREPSPYRASTGAH